MIAAHNPHLVVTVRCAAPGCINVRRQANHWFLIKLASDQFTCRPFLPDLGLNESDLPACGQACAQKLLEQFLASTASYSSHTASTAPGRNSTADDRRPLSTPSHLEDNMQLPALNHQPQQPLVDQNSFDRAANPDVVSHSTQHGLASCVYIGLHCSNCGDVRQAISELPAGESTLCPECGASCSFSRLGTGLTTRELPFHELPSSRQSINPAGHPPEEDLPEEELPEEELPEIAPRAPTRQQVLSQAASMIST